MRRFQYGHAMPNRASSTSPGPGGRRRFIVVTGMPRSGTTGVGSALAAGARAAYLYEPLNPLSGLRSIDHYFPFPGPDGPDAALRATLEDVFRVSLRVRSGLWETDSPAKRLVKRVTGSRTRVSSFRIRLDPRIDTVVWKDPFASFLVPTLVAEYRLPVFVTVRSPLGAAASFRRLGWGFEVDRIRDGIARIAPGASFVEDETGWDLDLTDPVVNGSLLWRLLYGYLDHALPPADAGADDRAHATWVNVSALVRDPMPAYERLYAAAGLTLDARSRAAIEEDYADQGSATPSAKTHDSKRNVRTSNSYWSSTLSAEEQACTDELTRAVRARVEARIGSL